MSNIDTGGPAFPQHEIDQRTVGLVAQHFGMTLRDYFAAAVMQGEIAGLPSDCDWTKHMSKMAARFYAMADAMLIARKA